MVFIGLYFLLALSLVRPPLLEVDTLCLEGVDVLGNRVDDGQDEVEHEGHWDNVKEGDGRPWGRRAAYKVQWGVSRRR